MRSILVSASAITSTFHLQQGPINVGPCAMENAFFLQSVTVLGYPSFPSGLTQFAGRALPAPVAPVVEHIVAAHVAGVRLRAHEFHESVATERMCKLPGFFFGEPHQGCFNHDLTIQA